MSIQHDKHPLPWLVNSLVAAALLLVGSSLAQSPNTSSASAKTPSDTAQPSTKPSKITPPYVIKAPDPTWHKKSGTTEIWLTVGADGLVHDPKITKSFNPKADASALEAVQKWTFNPATKDGVPVPVQITVKINFVSW
jgi:TonB family protein